jgi:hypothetical protein
MPNRGPDRLISRVTRGGIVVWLQAGAAAASVTIAKAARLTAAFDHVLELRFSVSMSDLVEVPGASHSAV